MKNLFFLAQDGNADELFATIESDHTDDTRLNEIKDMYENAQIEDKEFCDKVLEYLKPPVLKAFIVVMCIKEEWDEPGVELIYAFDEDGAHDAFEKQGGFEEGELDEGIENGEIHVIIKEVEK